MPERNCHLIHMDDTKHTAIVGYIGEPDDKLHYETLAKHLNEVIDTTNRDSLFVNIVPLNTFGFRVTEQRAVVDFINAHSDHIHVTSFIHHFNITEEDIAELLMDGDAQAQRYLVEQPINLIEEILVDAMLEQVHA